MDDRHNKKMHMKHPVFRLMLQNRLWQYALVMLATLVFLSFFVTITARNDSLLRDEYQKNQLTQCVQEIEQELLSTDYRGRTVMNSRSFREFCYMYKDLDWYTRFTLQRELYKELVSLRDDCKYVQSAWLYIPVLDKTISDQRISAPGQDWLTIDCTDGTMQQLEDCRVAYFMRGASLSDLPTAVLCVIIDQTEIQKQLSWLRRSDDDSITLLWSIHDDQVLEAAKSKDICVYAENNPFYIRYRSEDHAIDAFIHRIIFYCLVFVLMVLLVLVFNLFSWYRRIYQPLYRLLIEAFDRAAKGDYKYRISIDQDSAFFSIYDSYNHMMEKTDEYVENNLKQQILLGRANLKQLQSQINPHFMYNSYYVLYRLIKKGDQENRLHLAEHLGQFYHYITRNADDEKRLREEVNHARNYAAIQKFRFRDALDIEINDPPAEIADMYVPRLILQPLLENAFKYAYETEHTDGLMRLVIRYQVYSDSCLDIIVENSGTVTEETLQNIRSRLSQCEDIIETTALVNIHRRLRIYYGESSALTVARSELGGLQVCMHIDDSR